MYQQTHTNSRRQQTENDGYGRQQQQIQHGDYGRSNLHGVSALPATSAGDTFSEWDAFFSKQPGSSSSDHLKDVSSIPSSHLRHLEKFSGSKSSNHNAESQPRDQREEYDPFADMNSSLTRPNSNSTSTQSFSRDSTFSKYSAADSRDSRAASRYIADGRDFRDVTYSKYPPKDLRDIRDPSNSKYTPQDIRDSIHFKYAVDDVRHDRHSIHGDAKRPREAMERDGHLPLMVLWDSSKVFQPPRKSINMRKTKWSREYDNPLEYSKSPALGHSAVPTNSYQQDLVDVRDRRGYDDRYEERIENAGYSDKRRERSSERGRGRGGRGRGRGRGRGH